jgi:glucuronoarabinoxylan endo-1,4-beta-xylanase
MEDFMNRKRKRTGITLWAAVAVLGFAGCPQTANDLEDLAGIKAVAPFITVQPGDYQPALGTEVFLEVEATVSDDGELSYQWYKAASVGGAGELITDAILAYYSPPTAAMGTTFYYVDISNSNNETKTTTKSRYAMVFVVDPADAGTPSGGLNILVDTSQQYQYIQGFGGMMNNWTSPDVTFNDADTLFNPDKLGLNILRMEITPEPLEKIMDGTVTPSIDNSDLFDIGKLVNKYGGKIIGCPWTPPDECEKEGGHLKPEFYRLMANHLVTWVKKMETGMGGGNKVYAISIQNEPNENPDWCNYTPEENRDFIKQQGPYIHDQLPGIKLFPGEHSGFVQSFYQPIIDDPDALAQVDGFAGHFYGGAIGQKKDWAVAVNKEVWMTEHYYNTSSNYAADPTWANVWQMARDFHNCMMNDYNAYVMWYAKRFYCLLGDTDTRAPNQRDGIPTLRGYLMSHYAKYATGRNRVDAKWKGPGFSEDIAAPANVYATAYADDKTITLVMFNQSTAASTGNDWINIRLPVEATTPFAVATYNEDGPAPAKSSLDATTVTMKPTPVVMSVDRKTASVKMPPSTIVSIKFYK